MWEEWKLIVDCAAVVSTAIAELVKEDKEEKEDEEAHMGEGSFTEDLAPKQALAPQAIYLRCPGFGLRA